VLSRVSASAEAPITLSVVSVDPLSPETIAVRRRWRRWALTVLGLFALAGLLAAISGGSRTVQAIAFAIGGVAGVVGVSAVFYEVGASEDRDRAAGSDR
jgi:uncharacterized membrane protein YuzA (DUF378 family)